MDNKTQDIDEIEIAIDRAFSDNPIAKLPYSQAIWTLLAGAEEYHFRHSVVHPATEAEMAVVVDGLLNALTYPVRTVYKNCVRDSTPINFDLNDYNYEKSVEWIGGAEDYLQFCSIFPLYRRKQITIEVKGNEILIHRKSPKNIAYEAYDRFIGKRGEMDVILADPTPLVPSLLGKMHRNGNSFQIKFTRRLVEGIVRVFGPQYLSRFVLPPHWKFVYFDIAQFKLTMACLQSLASAWMVARQLFAEQGILGAGYSSSVLIIKIAELENIIFQSTKIDKIKIQSILKYLTFGQCEIRDPDIAIQPIINLENGSYAISPLLLMHTNAERNLCVLLNQIPLEKKNYSFLVQEKESELFNRIVKSLANTSFDFRSGKIHGTDIDIAIIDRSNKVCLCLELKWFIEPAEIREVEMRSDEVAKGIKQGLKLMHLFEVQDQKLFTTLGVDASFDFQAAVGSENFIGREDIQDKRIPVLRVWHLISHLVTGDLNSTVDWLRQRKYLPKEGRDFEVRTMPITVGGWRAEWYGLRPLESS
ncbi:hypothetical protein [Pseudoduganella aquatica]|uniref:Restriction endonuclease n=1 Tax=Pseudoduganella aquatica TaxID=2660641 RepID=A0A7X4HGS0_9BURK|nr:hypothetical protein [Pseudoduganella aquatica]MYN10890.1 hypothetical protein [Pseudoduganella aquatica]